jgi:hypothetical protein
MGTQIYADINSFDSGFRTPDNDDSSQSFSISSLRATRRVRRSSTTADCGEVRVLSTNLESADTDTNAVSNLLTSDTEAVDASLHARNQIRHRSTDSRSSTNGNVLPSAPHRGLAGYIEQQLPHVSSNFHGSQRRGSGSSLSNTSSTDTTSIFPSDTSTTPSAVTATRSHSFAPRRRTTSLTVIANVNRILSGTHERRPTRVRDTPEHVVQITLKTRLPGGRVVTQTYDAMSTVESVIAQLQTLLDEESKQQRQYRLCLYADESDASKHAGVVHHVTLKNSRVLNDLFLIRRAAKSHRVVLSALTSVTRLADDWDTLQLISLIPRAARWLHDELHAYAVALVSELQRFARCENKHVEVSIRRSDAGLQVGNGAQVLFA